MEQASELGWFLTSATQQEAISNCELKIMTLYME
jgi:hypothetical protein